jgi:hypothetical protein
MAIDTAPKQNDTPAQPAAATKPAAAPKTAAKSRPRKRATTARTRTAAKSRKPATTRKPAARAARSATTAATRAQATAQNGGRQIFAGVIDAQEKTVTAIVDYQARAAELSQIPGATALASAQAQLLRGATDVYVSAARALLR